VTGTQEYQSSWEKDFFLCNSLPHRTLQKDVKQRTETEEEGKYQKDELMAVGRRKPFLEITEKEEEFLE
jgi:hypothetical protein